MSDIQINVQQPGSNIKVQIDSGLPSGITNPKTNKKEQIIVNAANPTSRENAEIAAETPEKLGRENAEIAAETPEKLGRENSKIELGSAPVNPKTV